MLANNEVGTIQPIAEIAARVRDAQGRRCSTSTRSRRRPTCRPRRRGARRRPASRSAAHKFEGPKGVGALYVRHGTHILAQQQGGTQERHRRAGTENVAGAVGLAAAYELSCAERPETVGARCAASATGSSKAVLAVAGAEPTGHPKDRLPGLLSMVARDTDGASVAMALDLEGHRLLGRLGLHDRLDRGQPRPDARWAIRRRRRAARSACRSAGRRPRTRSSVACDVVPRVLASMRVGHGRGRRRPARAGRARVSRILVAMSGGVDSSVAAALLHDAGPRGRRRLDAPARRRRQLLGVQEELLLARRRRRRPAGRGPARHPVLRHEPRARVRRRRARSRSSTRTSTAGRRARASTATRT